MLQGLLLPIAIGAGIGGISALARGESSRNVLKSMGLGALFAGVGGGLFRAAGLGGGTSNAAFILKYLLKNKVKKSLLNKLEKTIGSDLKLFFKKQGLPGTSWAWEQYAEMTSKTTFKDRNPKFWKSTYHD